MGSLERRARRLEQAELRERARQIGRSAFKEALRRVSTAELLAMHEHFEHMERDGREEWSEEGEPLMRLLLALMQKARHDEPEEFPWRSETHGREEQSRGEYLETGVKRLEDAGGAESARRAPVPRWSTSTAR